MIIHLVCATSAVIDYKNELHKIMTAIYKSGHTVAYDWIESYRALPAQHTSRFVQQNVEALERCDLVIVEGTEDSFDIGFQVSAALSMKKPILYLTRDTAASHSTFIQGLEDPFMVRVVYTPEDLQQKVVSFLKENTISTKDLRFNFVIDRQIYNHLRWKSSSSGKTKAEVVRGLLLDDLQKGKP